MEMKLIGTLLEMAIFEIVELLLKDERVNPAAVNNEALCNASQIGHPQ
jgi:hypothetical protein